MDVRPDPRVGRLLFDEMTAGSSEDTNVGQMPVVGGCSLDFIGNKPLGKMPISVGSILRLQGWAATSLDDGGAPDVTSVVLVGAQGDVHRIRAQIVDRPDVNEYFKKPSMGRVGFVVFANVSTLSGQYTVYVEPSKDGKRRACPSPITITIESA